MAKGDGVKWLQRGCFGCLGLLTLGTVVIGVLLVLPLMVDQPEPEPVSREWTPPLPPTPPAPVPPDGPAPGDSGGPESVVLPDEPPPGEGLRVDLDLSTGSFVLLPGEPGQPLRVEADYDAGSFELEEGYDEASNTYRIRFGTQRGWLSFLGRTVEGDNEVRIYLPPDQPLALTGEIGIGETDIEIGGLWITSVDLDLGVGDHTLSVDRPTLHPVSEVRIDASVGEVVLRNLGNASPARVRLDQGIGEMRADLRGAWRRDSEIQVEVGIGDCRVRVPDDVEIKVVRSGVNIGESHLRGLRRETPPPPGAPVLTLRLDTDIGSLRVD